MKKVLYRSFIFFTFLIPLIFPHLVYAHFLATDRAMSITLHVDRDDDPTPGQQAYLYFLFSDETNKFQIPQCNCVVTISEQGKQIYSQKLIEKKHSKPSIWGTSMSYIFPQRDVYHFTITGNPLKENAFQPLSFQSWGYRWRTLLSL